MWDFKPTDLIFDVVDDDCFTGDNISASKFPGTFQMTATDNYEKSNVNNTFYISEPKGYCPQAKYDDFQGPMTIGTYQFTYNATDVFGNTAPVVNFTVTVKDLCPPVMRFNDPKLRYDNYW